MRGTMRPGLMSRDQLPDPRVRPDDWQEHLDALSATMLADEPEAERLLRDSMKQHGAVGGKQSGRFAELRPIVCRLLLDGAKTFAWLRKQLGLSGSSLGGLLANGSLWRRLRHGVYEITPAGRRLAEDVA